MRRVSTALLTAALLGSVMITAGVQAAAHAPARLNLHPLWVRSIQPNADSAPVYLSRVTFPGGKHRALVYVLAGNNTSNCDKGDPVTRATLYALNAKGSGTVWTRSTTGPSRCTTASPAVAGQWVYAPGLEGKVHRYAAATGKEYRKGGWPHAFTLIPQFEKASAALVATSRYLYITTSGYIGDQDHYEGHLVTIDLRSGKEHVFNSLCSNIKQLLGPTPGQPNYCSLVKSGLFGRGQAAIDPVTKDVWIVSGNGPWDGHTSWGDSLLKLDPSGKSLLDAFTPTNQASLEQSDEDLGSTGPALLPEIRQNGHAYHLLVQGGKGPACDSCSGVALRLLNRDNLSGQGGPGHLGGDLQDLQAPGSSEVLTAPAVWQSPSPAIWVLYANDSATAGYRLSSPSAGKFRLDRIWQVNRRGTTPIVSGGVLYVAHDQQVLAYDPTTGTVLAQAAFSGVVHWEYPLVAGGRLYQTDENGHITAFSITK